MVDRRSPPTILLVEDNPADAELTIGLLGSAGPRPWNSHWVSSVEEAARWMKRERPDALLLDLSLPGTSGLGTLERIAPASRGVPIVVLTGLDDDDVGSQAVLAGAEDYLVKNRLEGPLLRRTLRHAIERHALRRSLAKQNQELETQNRRLDEFAHVLGHDIKAPIRSVLNQLRYLLEDHGSNLDGAARSIVLKASDGARQASQLVDEILADTAVGRVADRDLVPLAEVCREAVDILDPPAGFQVRIEAGSNAVWANRVQFQRVLQNLLANAIKHHDRPEGHVFIRAVTVDPWVEVVVEDDGPGIPSDLVHRLFEKSATGNREHQAPGLGLGLYVSRRIVEAHGGTLSLVESSGRGAAFKIVMPSRPEAKARAAPPPAATPLSS